MNSFPPREWRTETDRQDGMRVKRRTPGKLYVEWTNAYLGKSKIINKAIQDIGMGRYQWELFVLCGFGWLADK